MYMNRKIKFRVWFVNQMAYNIPKILLNRGEIKEVHINWDENDDTHNPADTWTGQNDWVLMQHTDLTDKNGKDIYEGDVVKERGFEPEAHIVRFNRGAFCLEPINGIECHLWSDIKYVEDEHGEVIGNIYENPNLLEEK